MKNSRKISDYPELMKEWDYEKNEEQGLNPSKIPYGSTKKAFWICSKGHSYYSRIDHRVNGVGCPFCAGKQPIKGENDLATLFPDIAAEWDYELNEFAPEDYLPKSNKKAHFICSKCGSKYVKSIQARVESFGCSKCGIKVRANNHVRTIIKAEGSFADIHPELLCYWDYEKNESGPEEYTPASSKKVWWICNVCNSSYQQKICYKSNGGGCPICNGKIVKQGFNDLATLYPDLITEWNFKKNKNIAPEQITPGSDKKIEWICSKGHEWQATISSRAQGADCPFCSGLRAISGETDLLTVNPILSSEWATEKNGGLLPSDVTANSNKKVWWKCPVCGYKWKAVISSRNSGRGCPKCGRKKSEEGRHRSVILSSGAITQTHPKLVHEWDYEKNASIGLFPDDISAGSDKKAWWKCRKGHSWQATVSSRTAGNNCPICSSQFHSSFMEQAICYYYSKVTSTESRVRIDGKELDIFLPAFNIGIEYNGRYWHKGKNEQDKAKVLFFKNKGIRVITVEESNKNAIKDDVVEFSYSSNKNNSFDWAMKTLLQIIGVTDYDIDLQRDETIIMSNYYQYEKANSIAVKYPALAAEWDTERNGSLKPEMFGQGSTYKATWICSHGHRWKAAIYSRVSGKGCPFCDGKRRIRGVNDFASMYPELMSEWNYEKNQGIDPTNISPHSHKVVTWVCQNCGHEWSKAIGQRVLFPKCPICKNVPAKN